MRYTLSVTAVNGAYVREDTMWPAWPSRLAAGYVSGRVVG